MKSLIFIFMMIFSRIMISSDRPKVDTPKTQGADTPHVQNYESNSHVSILRPANQSLWQSKAPRISSGLKIYWLDEQTPYRRLSNDVFENDDDKVLYYRSVQTRTWGSYFCRCFATSSRKIHPSKF